MLFLPHFKLSKYWVIVPDDRGYRDTIKRVKTMTFQADSILSVAPGTGKLEASIQPRNGHTQACLLAYTLDVKQLMVVHKLDSTDLPSSQKRHKEIIKEVIIHSKKAECNCKTVAAGPTSDCNGSGHAKARC